MVRSESLDSLRRSAASCVRVHAAVAQVPGRRVCVRVLYTRQAARNMTQAQPSSRRMSKAHRENVESGPFFLNGRVIQNGRMAESQMMGAQKYWVNLLAVSHLIRI